MSNNAGIILLAPQLSPLTNVQSTWIHPQLAISPQSLESSCRGKTTPSGLHSTTQHFAQIGKAAKGIKFIKICMLLCLYMSVVFECGAEEQASVTNLGKSF